MNDDNVINLRADERCTIMIDVGRISAGHQFGGQFVITMQIAPFRNLDEAQQVERAVREAVHSRLGVRLKKEKEN